MHIASSYLPWKRYGKAALLTSLYASIVKTGKWSILRILIAGFVVVGCSSENPNPEITDASVPETESVVYDASTLNEPPPICSKRDRGVPIPCNPRYNASHDWGDPQ